MLERLQHADFSLCSVTQSGLGGATAGIGIITEGEWEIWVIFKERNQRKNGIATQKGVGGDHEADIGG